MRLVKAHEMQEMDRLSIREMGIPGIVLMENAARGASRVFLEHFSPEEDSCVLIICGRGNNGGDGYAMARYLSQAGLKIRVVVLAELDRISGDALTNLEIIKRMDLDICEVPGPSRISEFRRHLEECDYMVDGIFGTGLNSPVEGFYGQVLEEISAAGKPLMAIDMPSGLNADTGQIMGVALKADLTVTFGFPKLGQVLFPGVDCVGRLTRVDIGIPKSVSERVRPRYHMIEPGYFSDLLRNDKKDIHKGDRGHLLIIAGSTGKTGAASLTALGALRAGAGLVTLCIPASLNVILEAKLTEAMTVPLPETGEGSLSLKARDEILRLAEGKTALAIGPGLSTNQETSALVREIVAGCDIPTVVDADGINALAGTPDSLRALNERMILTPHPGEMGRLIGLKSREVQIDRAGIAEKFVEDYGSCLVLKGARTLIAGPGGEVYVNPTGNPALASGGSGDVLTGLISGFLARGLPVIKAAIAGVYLHGMAADLLSEDTGEAGLLAGELPHVIPLLMDSLSKNEWPLREPPAFMDLYQPL